MNGIRLIVNADDFGYSKGVNYGILEAFQEGIVTSATMMCNYESSTHAFELMKDHPDLSVGIHFVLTSGRPISTDVPSLINSVGNFHTYNDLVQYARYEDIERELHAQLERFLSSGTLPTHIDSHHHIHAEEIVLPIVLDLARQYQLPVRRFALNQEESIKSPDLFIYQFYGENITVQSFISLLDIEETVDCVEIMTHPAYLDAKLLKQSKYSLPRVNELETLTNPRIKEVLHERGTQLISYKEIG